MYNKDLKTSLLVKEILKVVLIKYILFEFCKNYVALRCVL